MAPRRRADSGASAVEYGLLVAAIAGLIFLVIYGLMNVNGGLFRSSCTAIETSFRGTGGVTEADCTP